MRIIVLLLLVICAHAQDNAGNNPGGNAGDTAGNSPDVNGSSDASGDAGSSNTTNGDGSSNTPTVGETSSNANAGESSPPQVPCALPDGVEGAWLTTLWDSHMITFTNTSFATPFDLGGRENIKEMECHRVNDAGDYVFRSSQSFTHLELQFNLFTCINIAKTTDDIYHLIVKTARDARQNGNEPVGMRYEGISTDDYLTRFCSQTEADWIEGTMLREGKAAEAGQDCPEELNGNYNVTYTNDFGQNMCPDGATATTCNMPKAIEFDFSMCNETEAQENMLSAKKAYHCITGTKDKLLLYIKSNDTNAFTPFSCANVQESEDSTNNSVLTWTQTAGGCGGTWKLHTDQPSQKIATLAKTDECEVPVPAANNEETTLPGSHDDNGTDSVTTDNGTDSDNDNHTNAGDGSNNNSGNNGTPNDGNGDAAISLVCNSVFVIVLATLMTILVAGGGEL